MKKLGVMVCIACALLISGCKSKPNASINDETIAIKEGDYAAMLPFDASSSRIKHAQTSTNLNESLTIGAGIMSLSKNYFSPDKYIYKEGQFLTYDVLDATGLDHIGLLGRTSQTNPNGMNLAVGTQIDTEDGIKKIGPMDVLLVDIYELDWYDGKDLEGLSIGIVLNDKIGDRLHPNIVKDEKLRAFGEEVGRKVVSYLRKTHPEIGQKTPIYVALYKESGVNTVLPGTFIEEAYFASKTIGEYSSIHQEWALFPSTQAHELDANTSSDFDVFAKDLKNFFPEDTSVIGTGRFDDGVLVHLGIEVSMHAKTWAEVNALIQKVNASLSTFTNKEMMVKVSIKSDHVLVAAMQRDAGENNVTVIQLID